MTVAPETSATPPVRFCNGVSLSVADDAEKNETWIHLATAGTYLGHWQGAFVLTGKTMEEIVRNFRNDERYGLGKSPVVPYDYEHASEQAPTSGSIPAIGTPAPAWALEMEVRDSAKGPQLWALTKLGDQVKAQIKAGEYRYVSMAFTSKGVDSRSGATIGHMITSIAFTNQPFLTGLEPIAAKARETGQAVVIRFDQGPPTLVTDPSLATPGQDEVQHNHSAVAPAETRAPDIKGDHMATEQSALGKMLAAKLTAAGLNNGRLLQADEEVGEAVAEAITGSGDLSSLLEGLGVSNAEQALANIAELKDAKAKIETLSTELADALSQLDQAQSTEVEADVADAMAAKAFDPSVKSALLSQRKMLTKEHGHLLGSEKFLEQYGVKRGVAPTKGHLLNTVAAGKNGKQFQPVPLVNDPKQDESNVIDLSAYMGANETLKLLAYCDGQDPSFKAKPWGERVSHVSQLRRTSTIVNGASQ